MTELNNAVPTHLAKTKERLGAKKVGELDAIMSAIARELAPRLDAITRRLAALEERPAMRYCGVWKAGAYQSGDCVTAGGHLWCARRETESQPGSAPDDWQMAMRKPRDGRDAKEKWDRSASYRPGAIVVHRGAVWAAQRETIGEEPSGVGHAWAKATREAGDGR